MLQVKKIEEAYIYILMLLIFIQGLTEVNNCTTEVIVDVRSTFSVSSCDFILGHKTRKRDKELLRFVACLHYHNSISL